MTEEKLNKAKDLKKEIEEKQEQLKRLEPNKNVWKNDKISFINNKIEINIRYRANDYSNMPGDQIEEKKYITIESKMIEFLFYQYKNKLMAELHLLQTKFNNL